MKIKYLTSQFIALLTFIALCASENLQAQTRPVQALQQQKVRFFNERLQLTPVESKAFWPVYNDFQNRRDKVTADRTLLMNYFANNNRNMTQAEVSDAINKYLQLQQQENDLLHDYTARFLEFLPPVKVMHIFIVENDFKRRLLETLRDNSTIL